MKTFKTSVTIIALTFALIGTVQSVTKNREIKELKTELDFYKTEYQKIDIELNGFGAYIDTMSDYEMSVLLEYLNPIHNESIEYSDYDLEIINRYIR